LSDRLLHRGRLFDQAPLKVGGFAPASFDAPAPGSGSGGQAPGRGDGQAAAVVPAAFESFDLPPSKAPEPFKTDDLGAGPSLGYLFDPFDPKAPARPEPYREMDRPENRDFDYQDLDLRDQNIINTLDRAQRKARDIVAEAFGQGRRLEAQMLEAARLDADDLAAGIRSRAEAEAEGIAEAARREAAGIVAAAAAKAAEIDDGRTALEAGRADLDAALAEAEARGQALDARSAELDAREAALAARDQETAAIKASMEAKRAELERDFQKESAQALAKALEAGRAEGLGKGVAEGRSSARAEVLAKAGGFFKIIDRIGSVWRELWRLEAPFMATLAVEAAEAIVNKEIEDGRGLAAGALEACVEHLHKCHRVVFRVRPEDLAEVEAARAEVRGRLDGLVNIEFKADDSLGPGDLVMESDAGRLDATIKARRARIMGVLREALAQGLTIEAPPPEPAEAAGDAAGDAARTQAADQAAAAAPSGAAAAAAPGQAPGADPVSAPGPASVAAPVSAPAAAPVAAPAAAPAGPDSGADVGPATEAGGPAA
jgi:flagellar biosynthesis/type III secretory pathway protein FliH